MKEVTHTLTMNLDPPHPSTVSRLGIRPSLSGSTCRRTPPFVRRTRLGTLDGSGSLPGRTPLFDVGEHESEVGGCKRDQGSDERLGISTIGERERMFTYHGHSGDAAPGSRTRDPGA